MVALTLVAGCGRIVAEVHQTRVERSVVRVQPASLGPTPRPADTVIVRMHDGTIHHRQGASVMHTGSGEVRVDADDELVLPGAAVASIELVDEGDVAPGRARASHRPVTPIFLSIAAIVTVLFIVVGD